MDTYEIDRGGEEGTITEVEEAGLDDDDEGTADLYDTEGQNNGQPEVQGDDVYMNYIGDVGQFSFIYKIFCLIPARVPIPKMMPLSGQLGAIVLILHRH
jgi:hypothetical protein